MKKYIYFIIFFVLFANGCSKAKFYYRNSEVPSSGKPEISNKEIITYDDSLKIYAEFTQTPIIERQFPPDYPQEAFDKNWQGNVLLNVEILSSGSIGRILLRKTSGYKILDEAAISAAKEWKFVPAKLEDRAVTAWLVVEIRFKL